MEAQEKPTKPKNGRYTEATLIKMLKTLGIARPGTVVGMVTTVQDREYVIKKTVKPKEKEFKNYLFNYPDNFKNTCNNVVIIYKYESAPDYIVTLSLLEKGSSDFCHTLTEESSKIYYYWK